MSTLVLSLAGQVVGGAVGGPLGATIGRALGAIAGSAIDEAIFGDKPVQKGADIRLQTSSEGMGVPRIYGWTRLAGNIIWATGLERLDASGAGAKALGQNDGEEIIAASFAIGLCEGEVAHIGRIWADGQLLDTRAVTLRFYNGDATQSPDALIEAKQGTGNAPAYRGLAYLVFDRLDLTPFGNRIPQISVELCRPVGELEPLIKAVCVIPGATEFGYDPVPRVRIISKGKTEPENAHLLAGRSNWDLSIDELVALCPNLEHVALVVAWFGNDLRADSATVTPRVLDNSRQIKKVSWKVAGLTRAGATPVTTHEGAPAYGGTPDDKSVLAAIADLKSRGIKVTFYPFVLMDIAEVNTLTDPYTGTSGQPAYPWRGKMTCSPAPGVAGSPDASAAAATQITAFAGSATPSDFSISSGEVVFSGGADWGYRRFILHYAHLCALAGGVDTYLIGSEMVGLTTVRSGPRDFPFVDVLAGLAGDVAALLGATKLSYAADWTEYGGYSPPGAPADKLFHLDDLWAHADIDAIGIDNYAPLSDWREGASHLDTSLTDLPHDLDYLQSRIAGGEGYDWYYASPSDRDNQVRTAITDGLYSEPFVWRVKDVLGFWQNAHYHRVGGVRDATPTPWVPQSKPVWLTEFGCGAVDKGANQPNAFADPKSAQSAKPYYSDGTSDAAMQRQVLLAYHRYWQPGSPDFDTLNNPVSAVYADRMLDGSRLYVWAFDARPFPAFPVNTAEWSDGSAWATGHWLNGRLGAMTADELAAAVLVDASIAPTGRQGVRPLIDGAVIEGPQSARALIEPLLSLCDLAIHDGPAGLGVQRRSKGAITDLTTPEFAADSGPVLALRHGDGNEKIRALTLVSPDRAAAYQSLTATARLDLETGNVASMGTRLTLSRSSAAEIAKTVLSTRIDTMQTASFALPPARLDFEPGDRIELSDGQRYEITAIRDRELREIEARRVLQRPRSAVIAEGVSWPSFVGGASAPAIMIAQVPAGNADESAGRFVAGAFALPWPGTVQIRLQDDGTELVTLDRPADLGELTSVLAAAPGNRWDRISSLEITLYGGHAASASASAVLGGANRILVQKPDASIEIVGFENAELVAPGQYSLTGLLRGLAGTGNTIASAAAIGAPVMLLGAGEGAFSLSADRLGAPTAIRFYAGAADLTGEPDSFETALSPLLCLPPAQVRAVRAIGSIDIDFSWIRRGRLAADSWVGTDIPLDAVPEAYRITIFNGASPVRTIGVATPSATYTQASQTADFGAPPASFSFQVAQISPVLGAGQPANATFSA
jgi:Gene Transfer Agent (GTA)-like protein/putative tail protein